MMEITFLHNEKQYDLLTPRFKTAALAQYLIVVMIEAVSCGVLRSLALVLRVSITDFQSVTQEIYMCYWLVAMLIADFDG